VICCIYKNLDAYKIIICISYFRMVQEIKNRKRKMLSVKTKLGPFQPTMTKQFLTVHHRSDGSRCLTLVYNLLPPQPEPSTPHSSSSRSCLSSPTCLRFVRHLHSPPPSSPSATTHHPLCFLRLHSLRVAAAALSCFAQGHQSSSTLLGGSALGSCGDSRRRAGPSI
jgi:hypothetical protein